MTLPLRPNKLLEAKRSERGEVNREFVYGSLVGVVGGPTILVDVKGIEMKFPLGCDLTVEWVSSHLSESIMCLLEDGKVIEVILGDFSV